MVKRILRSTLFVTLDILSSTAPLIMGVLYSYFTQIRKEQLQAEIVLVAQGVALGGDGYSSMLNVSGLRTTWVDNEESILYDNQLDATEIDNHVNRKEIREALGDGYSESTRCSITLTTKSLYVAQRLDDGTVIRLSITQHSILLLFIRMFQPLILIIVSAIFLSVWVARCTTRRVVAPLNDLSLSRLL